MFFHAEFTIFIRSLISKYPVKLENTPDLVEYLHNFQVATLEPNKWTPSPNYTDTSLHVFTSQHNFVKTIIKHRFLALICAVDHPCSANGSEMGAVLVDV